MAAVNVLYEYGRKGFLDGGIVWSTDNIKTVLVDLDAYAKLVTAATNASPSVVTSTAHGFSNGDIVSIVGSLGNTAINAWAVVGGVTTNTFTLTDYVTGAAINGNGAWTSGGYIVKTSGALFLSDIAAGARIATSGNLASKTVVDGAIGGVADAADLTFTAVTGAVSEALVVYKDTGTASTSALIALVVVATNLPVTPNGGDIAVAWDNTAARRIFKL